MTLLNNSCDCLRFVQTWNHKAQLRIIFFHCNSVDTGKNEGPNS
jgi:hypothetical protein